MGVLVKCSSLIEKKLACAELMKHLCNETFSKVAWACGSLKCCVCNKIITLRLCRMVFPLQIIFFRMYSWFKVTGSMHPSSYEWRWEVAKHRRSIRAFQLLSNFLSTSITPQIHSGQEPILFYKIDFISPNFSFFKPIENLQTCISMVSLHHRCASIRLWSSPMT